MDTNAAASIASGPARATNSRSATIRVVRRYAAPVDRAFGAWLDPAVARRWLFATASRPIEQVEIDPREGGAFRLVDRSNDAVVEHAGRYLQIVPPRRLAFALDVDGPPRVSTRVTVDFASTATGCRLTLAHDGVPAGCASSLRARWIGILYGLGETLVREGGGREVCPIKDLTRRTPQH